jgi:hypothetical protein
MNRTIKKLTHKIVRKSGCIWIYSDDGSLKFTQCTVFQEEGTPEEQNQRIQNAMEMLHSQYDQMVKQGII